MNQKVILIVDDELVNLEFFDLMLTKLGFQVERAMDGEEALEKVSEVNPDIILLDNIMPKMTGREVTKLLKQGPEYAEFSEIPIIMFSAIDDVETKIEGFELGIEDYITKPFNFLEVLARIKAVLRGTELIKQLKNREQHIELNNSLNNALLSFIADVKKIAAEQVENTISPSNTKGMEAFILSTVEQAGETLTSINELEEKITAIQLEKEKLLEMESSVEGIDNEYQKHFRNFNESL